MAFELIFCALVVSGVTVLACVLTFAPKRIAELKRTLTGSRHHQPLEKSTTPKDDGPNKDRVWGSTILLI